MTDNNTPTDPQTTPEVETVVEPNFVQKFVNKHPRTAKVVAIIGGVTAVAGVATVTNTARKNRHHLASAKDNVLEAGSELAQAVSPNPETTDA